MCVRSRRSRDVPKKSLSRLCTCTRCEKLEHVSGRRITSCGIFGPRGRDASRIERLATIVLFLKLFVVTSGVGFMKHHTLESNIKDGHSWGPRPEHWDRGNEHVQRWKAWDTRNRRLERDGELRNRGGRYLQARATRKHMWSEYFSEVTRQEDEMLTCKSDVCETKRDGAHMKASLTPSGLMVCSGCPNPHTQGSWFDIWPSHWSYPDYHIDAQIIYSIPNNGENPIWNDMYVSDKVVIVRRGSVSIVELARRFQHLGAIALLIVDDGRCGDDFDCGKLGKRRAGEGFAALDQWWKWVGIVIPSFLIRAGDGKRIESMMRLTQVDIPGLGKQLVCEDDLT